MEFCGKKEGNIRPGVERALGGNKWNQKKKSVNVIRRNRIKKTGHKGGATCNGSSVAAERWRVPGGLREKAKLWFPDSGKKSSQCEHEEQTGKSGTTARSTIGGENQAFSLTQNSKGGTKTRYKEPRRKGKSKSQSTSWRLR